MTETQQPASVPAPVTTGSGDAAPSVPAVETPVAPAVEAPSAAPVTETPSTEPAVEPAKPDAASSVLGDAADAKPEVKPDAKTETKADTAKADAATEAKTEVVLPTYEELKFPDGFTTEKESLGEFTKLLGEIETGKLDHKGIQEKGQALIDLGVKSINESITKLNDYYVQIHEKQKTDWFDAFKGDADLGGDKVESTVKSVREAIDNFGGTAEQIKELRAQMKESGYGNYTPLIRLINNMQTKIASYTKETKQPVVPGAKPAPSAVKPYQSFYSKAQA